MSCRRYLAATLISREHETSDEEDPVMAQHDSAAYLMESFSQAESSFRHIKYPSRRELWPPRRREEDD
jgi:hypothetical protein